MKRAHLIVRKSILVSMFTFLPLCLVSVTPANAFDMFSNGWGAALNGHVGVSAPINSTPLYAPMGGNLDVRNRNIYQRDARERITRQRIMLEENSVSPYDIAPASGQSIAPSVRTQTGGIRGGYSYND